MKPILAILALSACGHFPSSGIQNRATDPLYIVVQSTDCPPSHNWSEGTGDCHLNDGKRVQNVQAAQNEQTEEPSTPMVKPFDCDGRAFCEPDSKTEPLQYRRWLVAAKRK